MLNNCIVQIKYSRQKFEECFPETFYPIRLNNASFTCATRILNRNPVIWMVLHAEAEGGQYFDSLGGSRSHDAFVHFLGAEYRCALVQTQTLFSSVCGQYCIFVMSLRDMRHSMDDIVHVFDIQVEYSDRFVTYFVKLLCGVE